MSTSTCLLVENRNHVLTLTLNQPEKRNALSLEMLEALQLQLLQSAKGEDIRVVVIAANGPVFCAGHDLKELTAHREDADKGKAFYQQIMALCAKVMQAIVHHPRPVIAKVQGMATAAGCQLVASCDLAICTDTARFCTPGVNIGLFCSTPMVALSRNLARKKAMEMLLLGEVIDAQSAQAFGLVNQVVGPNQLDSAVTQYSDKLCAKSTLVLAIGKEAFYQQIEMPLAQAYDYTSEVMVKNMLHAEAVEGIGAFIEKRSPHWQQSE
ncbi:MAG: enoyl-CoA hydratase [Robiginitomaculum sp.]|nr:MAG: enoyl-CoA hydratase [Robiginitomaculum sp.]